jgi:hypothetical protein
VHLVVRTSRSCKWALVPELTIAFPRSEVKTFTSRFLSDPSRFRLYGFLLYFYYMSSVCAFSSGFVQPGNASERSVDALLGRNGNRATHLDGALVRCLGETALPFLLFGLATGQRTWMGRWCVAGAERARAFCLSEAVSPARIGNRATHPNGRLMRCLGRTGNRAV